MRKSKLVVNRKSSSATTAIVLLLLAVLFITIGKIGMIMPIALSNANMIKYFLMPVVACLLFIVCILVFGRKGFFISVLPLVIAAVSIMIKAFELRSLVGYAELVICLFLVVIYCCTIFGTMRRFFFAAITVILLAFNSYFVVYKEITTTFYTFSMLSYEIGILFMFLGFVFAICGATRQKKINPVTATTVVPPIPGNATLAELKNAAVSEPNPNKEAQKEEVAAIENVEPESVKVIASTDNQVSENDNTNAIDNVFEQVSEIINSENQEKEPVAITEVEDLTSEIENVASEEIPADVTKENSEESSNLKEAAEEKKKSLLEKLFG